MRKALRELRIESRIKILNKELQNTNDKSESSINARMNLSITSLMRSEHLEIIRESILRWPCLVGEFSQTNQFSTNRCRRWMPGAS